MSCTTRLQDRQDIADLMSGWIYRDLRNWTALGDLFHEDGTIEITWFDGHFRDFIEGSRKMSGSKLISNHLVCSPLVEFNGDKALVETKAMISVESTSLQVGSNTHNRFFDRVEKRNGQWRLVRRQCIYDMSWFTFPKGFKEIDQTSLDHYPPEYAPLAYLLADNGFAVERVFPTRGSVMEDDIKKAGRIWLNNDGFLS